MAENDSPIDLAEIESLHSLDAARIALRWALERIHHLEGAVGDMKQSTAQAKESVEEERSRLRAKASHYEFLERLIADGVINVNDLQKRETELRQERAQAQEERGRLDELKGELLKSMDGRRAVAAGPVEGDVPLAALWDRIDAVCLKLWHEDRPAAVGLRALIEEFRGEVDSAAQQLTTSRDQAAVLDGQLTSERARAEALQKELEGVEAESIEFKETILKAELERDHERGHKMESFYKELLEKSKELEESWEARRRELDGEYAKDEEGLLQRSAEQLDHLKRMAIEMEKSYAQKEAELTASFDKLRQGLSEREAKCLEREDELRRQEERLSDKRHELDVLKTRLQEETAQVVREYQGRAQQH